MRIRRYVGWALAALFTGCAVWLVDPAAERGFHDEGFAEEEVAEHPHGTMAWWGQRLNADGTLPRDNVARMLAERERLLNLQPDGVPTLKNWRWLGPGNIGGRLRAIVVHPQHPSTLWVGSASGGIWKSTDGGASWFPLDNFPWVLPIGCLIVDPAQPSRLYAGTGEGVFDSVPGTSNLAAPRGAGIWVSQDGGQTWAQLPATKGPNWYFVNRLSFSAKEPRVLLAATQTGIWRSTDRGNTWSRRTTQPTFDVDFHPTDPKQAVAGLRDALPQYSTDGGLTWKSATGIFGAQRTEVAYAASSPNIVYAAVSYNGRIRIYRSTDGGRSYTLRTSGSGISTYSHYNNALWVDPTNPNILLVAGVRLYRSTDGGVTLRRQDSGVHPDFHAITAHPGFNGTTQRTVYVGHDGGISRTTDVYASFVRWTTLNNNLGVTQFYDADINTQGVILGGTQDNGTIRYNGGVNTWTRTFGGDGGFTAADRTNPNYFYGEYQLLGIFRSTDGGRSARIIKGNIAEARPNFIPPMVLDPNNPNRLLAGGARLWVNEAARSSSTWRVIKPAVNCTGAAPGLPPAHFSVDPPCNISAITVAEGSSDTIWVGHNNGWLYMTLNGTTSSPAMPTWIRVDTPAMPKRWVSGIAIDRYDHRRVYVSFMGYQPDNLWRTLDGGKTWQRLTGTGPNVLPAAPVTAVAVHRVLPGWLYAGTDVGLYWSLDDGQTWYTSQDIGARGPVEKLKWKDDRTLLVVTHGRGIYLADTWDAATVTTVGQGCGTKPLPPALAASPPVPGRTQLYTVTGAAANRPAWLFLALGPAYPMQVGKCTIQVNPAAVVPLPAGTTSGTGTLTYPFALPRDASLLGVVATAQAFIAVPGGPLLGMGEITNGVEMHVGL